MNHPTQDPAGADAERRRRRLWLIGAVAGAAAAAGFGLAWRSYRSQAGLQAVDASFWQRQFSTPEGQMIPMQSLRGKPLLLNFWATWCPPCIEELPLLSSFYRENVVNGWQVLGLAIDEPDPVRRFLARSPVSFPVAMAGASGISISRYFGNSVGALPFTAVVNSVGQIVQRKMGRITPDDLGAWTGLS
ncbi:MAG: TlpA family protein disulfide reductase [Rhodoferax sp.]